MKKKQDGNVKKIVKREKRVYQDSFTPQQFPGIAEEEMKIVNKQFLSSVRFEVQKFSEMYDDNEYVGLFMVYDDYETDEEFERRVSLEKAQRERSEARDKAEFERLSKKFANNS